MPKDLACQPIAAAVLAVLAVTAQACAAPAGHAPPKPAESQALGAQARDAAAKPRAKHHLRRRLVARLNSHRARVSLAPLVIDEQLNRAAEKHAQDMAENGFLDHEGSDGSRLSDRLRGTGYRFALAAENIANGALSPEEAVELWMRGEKHRQNILDPAFREVGIGHAVGRPGRSKNAREKARDWARAVHYWTLTLGLRRGSRR